MSALLAGDECTRHGIVFRPTVLCVRVLSCVTTLARTHSYDVFLLSSLIDRNADLARPSVRPSVRLYVGSRRCKL